MGICSIIIFSYVVLHDFFLCNHIYDFSATPVDSSYQFLCPLCCAKQVTCRDEKPLTWDDVGTRTIREPQFLFTISVLGNQALGMLNCLSYYRHLIFSAIWRRIFPPEPSFSERSPSKYHRPRNKTMRLYRHI